MGYWTGKRVLVTGGHGFLGGHIVDALHSYGAKVFAYRSHDFDLRLSADACLALEGVNPEVVIHAAAVCGGLKLNAEDPVRLLHDNIQIALNVFEAARVFRVAKLVAIGSACCYPDFGDDLREDQLRNGPVHKSVVGYGNAKRTLLAVGECYRAQYGLNSIHLVLANLYGPREPVDPGKSHVVGALVRKFVEAEKAGADLVQVWGSGNARRELLYVVDAAEGILRAAEHYKDARPLNLGTGVGVSIRSLADTIKEVVGFKGTIRFDTDEPVGVGSKTLDISRMAKGLAWIPPTSLRTGIEREVKWFREAYS